MSKPYDPELRKTEHGSKLYQTWKRVRKCPHCEEWDYFPAFYEWAMQNEYEEGAWLMRDDKNAPFDPINCFWFQPCTESRISQEFIDRWNETVNRIRKYYGMPPLEGTKYGD
jgi:hypothetical protein